MGNSYLSKKGIGEFRLYNMRRYMNSACKCGRELTVEKAFKEDLKHFAY